MKRLSIFLTILLLISNIVYSQVSRQWVARYPGKSIALTRDSLNNIYVIGQTSGTTDSSGVVIIKYSPGGSQLWVSTFTLNGWTGGPPVSIGLDHYGHVFAAGFTLSRLTKLLKYNNNGNLIWEVNYIDSNVSFSKMVVDYAGNTYLTGGSSDSLLIIKNDPNGTLLWRSTFKFGDFNFLSVNLKLDNSGNIYLSGSTALGWYYGFPTLLKYNSEGVLLWNKIYPSDSTTNGVEMDVDQNNVYLTGGFSGYYGETGIIVLKYSSNGDFQWSDVINQAGLSYEALDVKADNIGNVYVGGSITDYVNNCGYVNTCGSELIKYNSRGTRQWIRVHRTPGYISEPYNAIAIDNLNNIYGCAFSYGTVSSPVGYIKTTKYNSNGDFIWVMYDSGYGSNGHYDDILLDGQNNVCVTASNRTTTGPNITTIKYDQLNYSVSGQVTYRDNGLPVDSGYVKALYYDYSTSSIVTFDSTRILPGGIYTLHHVPQDSMDIMFYQNDEDLDFVPTYYVSTTDWRQATKIFVYQNLTGINGQVFRINGSVNPYSISGMTTCNSDKGQQPISDAIVYVQSGNVYKNYGISNGSGSYAADKLAPGSYTLTAYRMGFNSVSQNVTITNGNVLNINFNFGSPIGIQPISSQIPSKFNLYQNYPNPFNPETVIKFDIPKNQHVKIVIYDLTGREVNKLLDEEVKAGTYNIRWNGSNYASGVYFYRIETESYTLTKKMLMVK